MFTMSAEPLYLFALAYRTLADALLPTDLIFLCTFEGASLLVIVFTHQSIPHPDI